ncbi:MAG TPA: hypothetical protein VE078_15460, partial [Thermoanaerobaculia bacterium]|nr:hypothetical protein [Thermoanaerobaculia bacterium]
MPLCSRSALSLLLLGVLAPGALPAQEPYLVRDFNPSMQKERGLASTEVFPASDGIYYSFDDGLHGAELWKSNGSGGDSLVRDLCPGPCGSMPRDFAEMGGEVYFFADDGVTGLELWRTDGSPGGTTLVRDLCPGPCSNRPDAGSSLVPAGNALFFRARDAFGLVGLWTSDGTRAGTRRVADICPRCNAGIFDLTAVGDSVFFRADDSIHGIEAWSSDGAVTAMVRDDCPGACSSGPAKDQPDLFTAYDDGTLYWQLVAGQTSRWRLRSTASDLEDHPIELDQSLPPRLAVVDSALLLTAGNVLARIDIPTFTLEVVHDFGARMGPVVALGSVVFFTGRDPGHGFELWRSNGTDAGTQLVANAVPGSASGEFESLVAAAGKLFFTTNRRDSLWVSDGTAAGTHVVDNRPVASLTPDAAHQRVVFIRSSELWATDGSSSWLVRRIQDVPGSSSLGPLTAFAGSLLFSPGNGLWRSDGTPDGTTMMSSADFADPAPLQGGLVFRSGSRIWKTDGTASGTHPLLSDNFVAESLKVAGDRIFFSGYSMFAPDAFTGYELWSSDGTRDGTRLMKDIAPGTFPSNHGVQPNSSRPRQLTPVGSTLFFVPHSPDFGEEIWSSDGTPDGTILLADRCLGSCSSDVHLLSGFAGRLLFTSGFSLWGTNVDGLGASRIRQIGYSSPDPAVFQGRLFLFGELAGGREYLWSTDGTISGTVRVQEVSGLDQPRTAHEPTVLGNRLYFSSWTEAAGQELWVSDGTAAGTHLLADVRPGPESSVPRHLTAVGNRLFFTADDGTTGQELWMLDGTDAGARRVGDIVPGRGSAAPEDLTAVGGLLFFSADDGTNGRELWALDTTQFYAHCVPAADRLC